MGKTGKNQQGDVCLSDQEIEYFCHLSKADFTFYCSFMPPYDLIKLICRLWESHRVLTQHKKEVKMVKVQRNVLAVIVALGLVFLLFSCATTPQQEQIYNNAREIYNAGVETFLADFQLADAETKRKWADNVVPIMLDVEKALDDWGLVIDAGQDDGQSYRLWLKIKNDLIMIAAKYKGEWFTGLAAYK
jgi:hypothetical protein